jgi:hypothetical protein
VTADPIPLDRYSATLRGLSKGERAVAAHTLACKVHGLGVAPWKRKATQAALDELVSQGRAEQPYPGRYRATRAPAARGVISGSPLYVNGTKLEESAVTVAAPENGATKLDETGFAGAVAGLTLPSEPAGWDDEDRALLKVPCGPPGVKVTVTGRDGSLDLPPPQPMPAAAEQVFRAALAAASEERPLDGMFRSIDAVASAMLGGTPAKPATPAVACGIDPAAGDATVVTLLEYPDAIIAEAEVFARRAAKALEMAREQLEQAEFTLRAAQGARSAAVERVRRLEQIAGGGG